jgi:hypothetical protein
MTPKRCARVLAGKCVAMSLPARTRGRRLDAAGCAYYSKTINPRLKSLRRYATKNASISLKNVGNDEALFCRPHSRAGIQEGRTNIPMALHADKIVSPLNPINIYVVAFFGNHFKIAVTSSRNLPPA